MILLSIIFYSVGFAVCAWFFVGLMLFAFLAHVYCHPGTPLWVKVWAVFSMAMIMPKHLLIHGNRPRVLLYPANDEAAAIAARRWWAMTGACDCPGCEAIRRRESGK